MKKIEYLIIGDTHVPTARKYIDSVAVHNWTIYSSHILEAVEKYKPRNLLLLGDVFDPPHISLDLINPYIYLLFVSFFQKIWNEHSTLIHIIKGNHDGNVLEYFKPFEFINVYTDPYYDELEKTAFFPYKEIYRMKNYEKWNIKLAFGHFVVGRVKIGNWELGGVDKGEIQRFPSSKWFLGHIHHKYIARYNDVDIIYTGSAYPTNHNDPNFSSYVLLYDDYTYEFMPIEDKEIVYFYTFRSIDECFDFLNNNDGKFAIKLKLDKLDLHDESIKQLHTNPKVYDLQIQHMGDTILLDFGEPDLEKRTLLEYLIKYVEDNNLDTRIIDVYKEVIYDSEKSET